MTIEQFIEQRGHLLGQDQIEAIRLIAQIDGAELRFEEMQDRFHKAVFVFGKYDCMGELTILY